MDSNKIYWDISKLKNWPDNPREIKDEKYKDLKNSLNIEGQLMPLLVDTRPEHLGEVIGGNMSLRALSELGIKEIWVEPKLPRDDAHAFELAIKHNMRYGQYQQDILLELSEKYKDQIDLTKLDVDLREPPSLDDLLARFNPIEEDEVPEVVQGEAVSKMGEIYQLGVHRVMAGDATKVEMIEKLMAGKKSQMVFTDPPYNVSYGTIKNHPAWKRTVDTSGRLSTRREGNDQILNDSLSDEDWEKFVYDYMSLQFVFNDGAFYICMSNKEMYMNKHQFEKAGGHWASFIIWKKDSFVLSMQDYHRQYEPILYGWKEGKSHYWCGDRTQSDIWEVARPKSSPEHPTMKPIALCVRAIKNSCNEGELVMDLFGGSGSTLIACEQTKRVCYMSELDPKYVDVIRKRYWKYTHDNKEEGWEDGTKAIS